MRLTFPRVALAALVLAMPPAFYAFAQDQAPSSAPASDQPSSAPSSAPADAPSSAPPATDAPSSQEAPASDAITPAAKPDKHPRTSEEIYKDLDFFGQVFDRVRSEYVDPP